VRRIITVTGLPSSPATGALPASETGRRAACHAPCSGRPDRADASRGDAERLPLAGRTRCAETPALLAGPPARTLRRWASGPERGRRTRGCADGDGARRGRAPRKRWDRAARPDLSARGRPR
jgi:hypothetical protein